jgi:hypothetical protein
MRSWILCSVLTVIVLGAGCGNGRSELDPPLTQPGADGASSTNSSIPLITSCNDLPWNPVEIASVADVPSRLAGQWMKCGGAEPVNLPSPFEMTADGHWYQLVRDPFGSLKRLTGFGQAGTYTVPRPDSLVISFNNAPPGSTLESNIAFMDEPHLMQWGPGLYSITR